MPDYTSKEERLLKLIPRNGERISTDVLTKKFYQRDIPANGQQMVTNCMRSLVNKVKKNREGFKIKRTDWERPIQFWIEGG